MAAPVIFDGRAGRFRWPRRSFSMAAPVIFDGRAGRFRWPRRSFSMAAPVGFDGRAGRQLCPYEAQYKSVTKLDTVKATHIFSFRKCTDAYRGKYACVRSSMYVCVHVCLLLCSYV